MILFVFVKEKVEYYEKICRREFGGDERERGRGEVWAALSVSPTLSNTHEPFRRPFSWNEK